MKTKKRSSAVRPSARPSGVTSSGVVRALRRANGSMDKAAIELGITPRNLRTYVKQFNCENLLGDNGMTLAVSETRVELDEEGKVKRQWITSSLQKSTGASSKGAVRSKAPIKAKPLRAINAPKTSDKDLVAFYVLGDPHHGLQACKGETGTDWNMQKSAETHCAAADLLTAAAPAAEIGVLVVLGDLFHTDTSEGGQRKGDIMLDVSNRPTEMIDSGVDMLKYWAAKLLTKHKSVRIVIVQGNHDGNSTLWTRKLLRETFGANPRVQIDMQPVKFHYLQYGKCLIIATHGESTVVKNPDKFGLMIANDAKELWGTTEFRHALLGHVHTSNVRELTGVTIETFNSLTAPGAWEQGEGYRAKREANCLVFHKEFGLTQRITKGIREIEYAMSH